MSDDEELREWIAEAKGHGNCMFMVASVQQQKDSSTPQVVVNLQTRKFPIGDHAIVVEDLKKQLEEIRKPVEEKAIV